MLGSEGRRRRNGFATTERPRGKAHEGNDMQKERGTTYQQPATRSRDSLGGTWTGSVHRTLQGDAETCSQLRRRRRGGHCLSDGCLRRGRTEQ